MRLAYANHHYSDAINTNFPYNYVQRQRAEAEGNWRLLVGDQVKGNIPGTECCLTNQCGNTNIFQGLLHHVMTEQPSKPFDYFHQKLVEIKTEMETSKVSTAMHITCFMKYPAQINIGSTTFLTEVQQSSQQQTRTPPRW